MTIAAHFPRERVLSAFGPEASRATAMGGFMSGGAPRVVASLWKVSDTATAVLMAKFYDLLLAKKLAPAEALRAAQLEVRRERRYSAPHAWAG